MPTSSPDLPGAPASFSVTRRARPLSVLRHRWPVRLMHWVNLLCLTVMLGSGLQIFNASPSLTWGQWSDPATQLLAFDAYQAPDGSVHGVTQIGRHRFDTTGVLGLSYVDGQPMARAFPSWATLPGPQWLAMGRRWHFFFGWLFVLNGLCYLIYGLASGHLRRDLLPTRQDWRGLGHSLRQHLRFARAQGEQALHYNVLQKLSYLLVVFGFGSAIVLLGLLMSPRMDAVLAPLLDLVGGRQSARTLHFFVAFGFLGFVLVHLLMVLVSGPANLLRSMLSGRYQVDAPPSSSATPSPRENTHG